MQSSTQFIQEQEEFDRDALLVSTSDGEVHHTADGQYRENAPDNAQWSGESKHVDKQRRTPTLQLPRLHNKVTIFHISIELRAPVLQTEPDDLKTKKSDSKGKEEERWRWDNELKYR